MPRASVEGSFSEFSLVRSGVPQCSVLGPLLFVLYASNMWYDIKSNMIASADDTTLFAHIDRVHSRALVLNQLNTDLNIISER